MAWEGERGDAYALYQAAAGIEKLCCEAVCIGIKMAYPRHEVEHSSLGLVGMEMKAGGHLDTSI